MRSPFQEFSKDQQRVPHQMSYVYFVWATSFVVLQTRAINLLSDHEMTIRPQKHPDYFVTLSEQNLLIDNVTNLRSERRCERSSVAQLVAQYTFLRLMRAEIAQYIAENCYL